MTTEPYASARKVYWITDNGSSHRGQASVDRMAKDWPTAKLIHLPIHASWLNQIEIYFSMLQRKVLTPNDFHDLAEVQARLLGFADRWQHTATPFQWKFTRTDLHNLLTRIQTHQPLTTAARPIRHRNCVPDHLAWIPRAAMCRGLWRFGSGVWPIRR